jgi:hypothetical protein
MGRFMSPDWSKEPEPVPYASLENPQSLNLYSYGGNNPLSVTDPDGHVWEWLQKLGNWLNNNGWITNSHLTEQRRSFLLEHVGDDASANKVKNFTDKQVHDRYKCWQNAACKAQMLLNAASLIPGGAKPAKNFEQPTNPPQPPPDPASIPAGWRVRVEGPDSQYTNGYWRLEKPMSNGGWQGIDPSTMKPGSMGETHVPLPPPGS